MRRFALELDIDRPAAQVFAVLTDPALASKLQPGVERVELALPDGRGVGKEDVRLGSLLAVYVSGKKRPYAQRVVEFKPGRVYAVRCEHGVLGAHAGRTTYRYRVRPLKSGGSGPATRCRARLDAIIESSGPGKIFESWIARRAQKADADQLANLKKFIEQS